MLLLQGHADANFKDSHLRTAVHIAAMLGALDVLLSTQCIDPVFNRKYDADFSLNDIQGKTVRQHPAQASGSVFSLSYGMMCRLPFAASA